MDQPYVGLNDYYDRQYSAEDLQRAADLNHQDAILGMMVQSGMDTTGMVGGQTLDEIISQNSKELLRRRSYNHMSSYGSSQTGQDRDPRRSSMLEFGPGSSSDLEGFQFDPTPNPASSGIHRPGSIAQRRLDGQTARRRESAENLALNTHFQNLNANYSPVASSSPYRQSLEPSDSLNMDMSNGYLQNSMLMAMDYSAGGIDQDDNGDVTAISMFPQGTFTTNVTSSPIHQNLSNSLRGPMQDPGGGNTNGQGDNDSIDKIPNMQMSDQMKNLHVNLSQSSMPTSMPTSMPMQNTAPVGQINGLSNFHQTPKPPPPQSANLDTSSVFANGETSKEVPAQQVIPQYRNAYSSSGFDMLGVLMRVATRPKPQINIGAVDMSCAFVVCDVTQHDLPIVYCSDIFERLTGYTKHEILGRNCRFLQAPDGKIQAGVKRKYVDDQSVLRIKNMINQRQEAQISLINYRKGGQPFMNLLTMIPITWDSDSLKYYVGFQVDLVEQPTSITNKNPGKLCNSFTYCIVPF